MPTDPDRNWLLDGHNILYAMRRAFAGELADGHPGNAAREALVRRLVATPAPHGTKLTLYFDGSTPLRETRSEALEVVYPGGEGEQLADLAILRHLNELAASGHAATVVVVTRDARLARKARRRGAATMDPGEFLATWCQSPPDADGIEEHGSVAET